jgi:hypothetical protein
VRHDIEKLDEPMRNHWLPLARDLSADRRRDRRIVQAYTWGTVMMLALIVALLPGIKWLWNVIH